jgi:hypothetical protein
MKEFINRFITITTFVLIIDNFADLNLKTVLFLDLIILNRYSGETPSNECVCVCVCVCVRVQELAAYIKRGHKHK